MTAIHLSFSERDLVRYVRRANTRDLRHADKDVDIRVIHLNVLCLTLSGLKRFLIVRLMRLLVDSRTSERAGRQGKADDKLLGRSDELADGLLDLLLKGT